MMRLKSNLNYHGFLNQVETILLELSHLNNPSMEACLETYEDPKTDNHFLTISKQLTFTSTNSETSFVLPLSVIHLVESKHEFGKTINRAGTLGICMTFGHLFRYIEHQTQSPIFCRFLESQGIDHVPRAQFISNSQVFPDAYYLLKKQKISWKNKSFDKLDAKHLRSDEFWNKVVMFDITDTKATRYVTGNKCSNKNNLMQYFEEFFHSRLVNVAILSELVSLVRKSLPPSTHASNLLLYAGPGKSVQDIVFHTHTCGEYDVHTSFSYLTLHRQLQHFSKRVAMSPFVDHQVFQSVRHIPENVTLNELGHIKVREFFLEDLIILQSRINESRSQHKTKPKTTGFIHSKTEVLAVDLHDYSQEDENLEDVDDLTEEWKDSDSEEELKQISVPDWNDVIEFPTLNQNFTTVSTVVADKLEASPKSEIPPTVVTAPTENNMGIFSSCVIC